jgi:glycosyltransferase involved in cell wall biosynthesis
MFSIIIPTWNNLDMLKCCVRSIRQHSALPHEIILHINEGADGTLQWANTEGVAYTHCAENIGICKAVNLAFGKATKDYIVYMNDDMYVLPDWDKPLIEEIQKYDNQLFMFSATLIEPVQHNYPCMIYGNFGRDVATFQEQLLLETYKTYTMTDWYGASWPPFVVSRVAWLQIGGFSIEFSPGMYSDPDFSMKLWVAGCRVFKGLGQSRVYHFQSRSTGRVKKNNGRLQFMKKWGLPSSAFYTYYLKMGAPYQSILSQNTEGGIGLFFEKLKARLYAILR